MVLQSDCPQTKLGVLGTEEPSSVGGDSVVWQEEGHTGGVNVWMERAEWEHQHEENLLGDVMWQQYRRCIAKPADCVET